MSVSIIACPNCRTMLLNDTAQCPHCHHVLDESRPNELVQPQAAPAAPQSSSESPCPKCGEMVRHGLVRCWKCSTFMRTDMEKAYEKMQASPQPVIYSTLPDGTRPKSEPAKPARDDEFELRKPKPQQAPLAETAAAGNGSADDAGSPPPPPDVPHSVATGGDALLQVALSEEAEKSGRRRPGKTRSATGILVYCPNGHRIEVDQRHRGKTGRCPKCKSPFIVPAPTESESDAEADKEPESTTTGYGKYSHWMGDVAVHVVNPEKLKLKADSLKADLQLFDIGFADDEILFVTYTKRKGAAVAKSKSWPQNQEKLHEYLRTGGPETDMPAVDKFTLTTDQAKEMSIVYPAQYAHESMFAGLPVFGAGRIGIRVPNDPDPKSLRFASLTLTQFRKLAAILKELYGIEDLGANLGIPMEDKKAEGKCHYSEETLQFLETLDYYETDPEITLKLVGRKCAACGLVISEDSRKKEKIGGANGKGIAKAKCPKCQQKFGNISLFDVEVPEPPAEENAEAKSEETAAAAT